MQTYKCVECGYKFQHKRRPSRLAKQLARQYIWKRQTYADLAEQYGRSAKWVRCKLDLTQATSVVHLKKDTELVLTADTTFFSRACGLTVFRDTRLKKIVWWKKTAVEKAEIYRMGKAHLEAHGFQINAVVLDGRIGIREVFLGIPVQMCHFHQKQIVNRYLTTRPKLPASIALREIAKTIPRSTEKELSQKLSAWFGIWEQFLKQKTTNIFTGHWCYTHKRTRAAYRSLIKNLPYLYTYQRHPELRIPNTTNSLDGYFNRLKSLLNVHRGMNPQRRYKMITKIFAGKQLF